METIEVPIRKLIKKRLFFPNQTIPKCDVRYFFAPITNFLIVLFFGVLFSVLIHYLIVHFTRKQIINFEVTTFCAKYLGELDDEIYAFNGIPFAVSPSSMTTDVRDILGSQISKQSLRWQNAVALNSLESCFAGHFSHCSFNYSVWKCSTNKIRRRCISFQTESTLDSVNYDEKCLYLNIKIPKSRPKSAPVIVFLAGVNYASDISNKRAADYPFTPTGKFINDFEAIFVSVQYRLGVFGTFFDDTSLKLKNFAISDLMIAFRWIEDNIDRFGGDRERISLLAHGTAASLGLSVVLRNTRPFRSAWLASGSAHIPRSDRFLDSILRQLLIKLDSRCISHSFYRKYCISRIKELASLSPRDIFATVHRFYSPESSLASLFDIKLILNSTRAQNPFFSVDSDSIIDSPIDFIDRNTVPSIPIVLTTMMSELDGFPGYKDWNLKPVDKINSEIVGLLNFLARLSNMPISIDFGQRIWTGIKTTVENNRKSIGEIVVELMSVLRVTCPYDFIGRKIRSFKRAPVWNIVHMESPSQPIKGMLFPGSAKIAPFYGFDLLLLFNKESLFMKKLSAENRVYQRQFFDLYKSFVHEGNLLQVKRLNLDEDKLMSLDRSGLKQMSINEYLQLCEKLEYKILIEFLGKIN